jgi:CheY-like chemotaxis protein
MTTSRILLAAPHLRALATHQAFLTHLGYEFAVCTDGLECAERLRQDPPDLLALAQDLPWGRAEGVLALMAEGHLPAVPVLLLTESMSPPRLASDGRFPVRSFLPWPAPPRLLARSVRGLLSATPGHPSQETDAPADDWAAVPVRPWA